LTSLTPRSGPTMTGEPAAPKQRTDTMDDLSPEAIDALRRKLQSQIGDDVRHVYDHEALFVAADAALATLSNRLVEAEATNRDLHRRTQQAEALGMKAANRMRRKNNDLRAQIAHLLNRSRIESRKAELETVATKRTMRTMTDLLAERLARAEAAEAVVEKLCRWIEDECGCELPFDAHAVLFKGDQT
jgi:vacuolar-type H+-ATPase subunit I/STV1